MAKVYGRLPPLPPPPAPRPNLARGVMEGVGAGVRVAAIMTPGLLVLAMLFMFKAARTQDEIVRIQAAEIRGLELRIRRLELESNRQAWKGDDL